MNYIKNYSQESLDRNRILTILYKKIPSYALFNYETIENESVLNRYNWWKEISSEIYNNIELVSEALRKRPLALFRHRDAVAIFENEEDIKSIEPNMEKLSKLDCPAVIVTAPGNNVDFVSRNFAPKLGIPEDPVTGSAHCELIPYWSKTLNKKELLANQISKRGGKLYCTHNKDRVTIGGEAVTFLRGEIEI